MSHLGDTPPLDPDREQAYDWLVRELSKPEYTSAQPSLLDRIAQAIREWLSSLLVPGDGTLAAWIPVIIVLVVVAAVIAAILIWGMPRRNRASARAGQLFGQNDTRTAAELRRHAREAAQREDWDAAVLDAFRALARGLAERTIIGLTPGTTARGVAAGAASSFPDAAAELRDAASAFDTVRYLDAHADRGQYEQLTALDSSVQQLTPQRHDAGVSAL